MFSLHINNKEELLLLYVYVFTIGVVTIYQVLMLTKKTLNDFIYYRVPI